MNLRFEKVRWKNLLSYGNQFTEVDLSTDGVSLITGTNGSGKSTLLEAIVFALFGKPYRNINKPQLLNTITNKELVVELELTVGKNSYKIHRGIKPNLFEVYCNDVLLNQSAEAKDYQEFLERKILKTNYKTFCQVVILGSAAFVPFMQLPLGQRRGIIEELLDLQVFTVMNTLLKAQAQVNQEKLVQCQSEQRLVNEKIKLLTSHLQEIRSRSAQFIREKQLALKDLQTKIKSLEKEKVGLQEEIAHLGVDNNTIATIQSKIQQLTVLRTQMEMKVSQLKSDMSFFEQNTSCPTCKQEIDAKFSCEAVEQKSSTIQEVERGLGKLLQKHKELTDGLNSMLDAKQAREVINTSISHNALQLRLLRDQMVSVQKEIEQVQNDSSASSETTIADLEKEVLELQRQYNELQEDKTVLAAAGVLLKDGGIKTKIINQYVPIINRLISKYLSEFDMFVEFYLDEQFNEVIKSRHRDEFSYASFSEGEKQKIDLAILFTWRAVAKLRNSLNTNLLILDETFDGSLDGDSIDNLQRILAAKEKTSIFVISHRAELKEKAMFSKILTFKKHKNFSQLIEE